MPHLSKRSATAGSLLACLALVAACGDAPSAPRTNVSPVPPSTTPPVVPPAAPSTTVARVVVTYAATGLDTATWTIAAGGTIRATAVAYDSAGGIITGSAAIYRSSNREALSVDSLTGIALASKPGTASLTATVAGIVGTGPTLKINPATSPTTGQTPPNGPPVPPPAAPPTPVGPPPSPSTVALNVTRFDGGSGAVTVSSGVPLMPGALNPGNEGMVRVTIGGVEQAAYITGLPSLHPDGSLRAILVQFQLPSLGATGATGQLDIGTARTPAMTLASPLVTPGAVVAGTPAGLPQAAALPSDPNYLVATSLVGVTITSAAATSMGGVFARYESDFTRFANQLWAVEGPNWALANYYDRALIYYAMWVRTGDPTYWARAGQIAYDYRVKYLEANAYAASPHWSQLEGLEKHYLLTGDDMSRTAVGKTARTLTTFIPSNYMTRATGESRIAARVLHAQLLAWRLSNAGPGAAGQTAAFWGTQVDAAFAKIVAWQQADGSFPADGVVCGGQLNYMVGMQNDALIKVHDYYLPTSTSRSAMQSQIRGIVQKAVDYLWNTQWLATGTSFQYASLPCPGVGTTTPAPDLNNLISVGFSWVYRQTGDATYQAKADQIFAGGVLQAYLTGTKQFNENYTTSFLYLGLR